MIFIIVWILVPFTAQSGQMALISQNRVMDCAGRVIKVEKPFERVISLYPAHTENLFSLKRKTRSWEYPEAMIFRRGWKNIHGFPLRMIRKGFWRPNPTWCWCDP